ncbi:DUF6612 family protein [Bhargavaea beijingensis]|uniref:Lipoprotein n=1 Tax=Bhargavaea beijingensis TaxID=426756 RepID=A0A1G7GXQ2_9BACL|nr:DUF6612 family protein [Bhargavaea beijingensis]MCW1927745.1 hypothetical protein [Bhargavaea beijingensis]RSK33402.1 hypothetical protein EJA12_06940 [Bhargavaea beijingensis]SDE92729.1 hypothetical protein SAMN04488126_13025 [Bhargavaea beijingensis]
MKKLLMAMAAGSLTLGLAACNETAKPMEGTPEEKQSDLTAEEVYEKALTASQEMKSTEASVEMDQKISVPSQDVEMNTHTNMDMEMTLDPVALHQKGTLTLSDASGEEKSADIDVYMTEDGTMYMRDPQGEQWLKMTGAVPGLDQLTQQQPDPSEQLEQLREYAKDMKFEQNENEYILKLTADGEKFNELIKQTLQEQLPPEALEQMSEDEQKALENMNINELQYEMFVDKESFNMTAMNMVMSMSVEDQAETLNIDIDSKTAYSNINGIEKIEIPQEIIDSAVELPQQ